MYNLIFKEHDSESNNNIHSILVGMADGGEDEDNEEDEDEEEEVSRVEEDSRLLDGVNKYNECRFVPADPSLRTCFTFHFLFISFYFIPFSTNPSPFYFILPFYFHRYSGSATYHTNKTTNKLARTPLCLSVSLTLLHNRTQI